GDHRPWRRCSPLPAEHLRTPTETLGYVARRMRQPGYDIRVGIVQEPNLQRIHAEFIGKFINRALDGKRRGVLEGRSHIARRGRIGAYQPGKTAERAIAVMTGGSVGVLGLEEVVHGGLRIDLVKR